jgi:hypothetical protein
MISSVNGTYAGNSYSPRPDTSKSEVSAKAINTEREVKTVDPSKEEPSVSQQVSEPNQVNAAVKNEAIIDQKATPIRENASPSEDADALISMIESNRKVTQTATGETLSQMLPPNPASLGQLILTDSDKENPEKVALYSELVQNFKSVDTNNDNLVSYNEALKFINGA